MLTNDMMFRYQRELPMGGDDLQVPDLDPPAIEARTPGRLQLTAAVLGNTLAGGLFLSLMLLAPFILDRLLALS